MTDRELMENLIRAWETCKADLLMDAIRDVRQRLEQPDPAPPPWRGLTTAEMKTLWNLTKKPSEFAAMLEAKLKERNYYPKEAEQREKN